MLYRLRSVSLRIKSKALHTQEVYKNLCVTYDMAIWPKKT